MSTHLSIYLIIMSFFICQDENIILLNELKENHGWTLIENSISDSMRVYEKNIEDMELKALRV